MKFIMFLKQVCTTFMGFIIMLIVNALQIVTIMERLEHTNTDLKRHVK